MRYIIDCVNNYARVAQLVERDLAKVEAAGSSPVSRSQNLIPKGMRFFSFLYQGVPGDGSPAHSP